MKKQRKILPNDAESDQNKDEKEKGEDSSTKNESFDANTLKSYIEATDYENIIKYIEKYDIEALNINDKNMAQNAVNLIKEGWGISIIRKRH